MVLLQSCLYMCVVIYFKTWTIGEQRLFVFIHHQSLLEHVVSYGNLFGVNCVKSTQRCTTCMMLMHGIRHPRAKH
jgi:hypothetical protein